MAEIRVTEVAPLRFRVEVTEGSSSTAHQVTVSPQDRERLGPDVSPERLVEESFRFLLEREPKESILASFELSAIAGYFPEYPEEIRARLGRP